jgi:hypothetical protein
LDFIITGAEVANFTQFEELLKNLEFEAVLADKGCDSNEIVKTIESFTHYTQQFCK